MGARTIPFANGQALDPLVHQSEVKQAEEIAIEGRGRPDEAAKLPFGARGEGGVRTCGLAKGELRSAKSAFLANGGAARPLAYQGETHKPVEIAIKGRGRPDEFAKWLFGARGGLGTLGWPKATTGALRALFLRMVGHLDPLSTKARPNKPSKSRSRAEGAQTKLQNRPFGLGGDMRVGRKRAPER